MDTPLPSSGTPPALPAQPIARVERWGVEFVLLGTAHVSRHSVDAVRALLETEHFDAVAVELCSSRAAGLRDPEQIRQMDLFRVIRDGKVGMVAASLALGAFQRRLAERFGVEPGAEMLAAMDGADARALPCWLIDREVGTTLKRAWRNVGFGERMRILGSLGASVFGGEETSEKDIEALKQGDMLEDAFGEFARDSATLFRSLIGERDRFMAASLQQQVERAPQVRRVLVVIGAGHLAGLSQMLREGEWQAQRELLELNRIPPASRWPKWIAIGMVLALFAVIAYAFFRSPALGFSTLLDWALFTAGLAALGGILAGGHPLSILVGAVVAPFKPIRILPPGAFAAMTELLLRRPRVADFEALKGDLVRWRGWWRNRVARILLLFMLVNLGALAGEYIAGIKILRAVF
ncbi:TraB/GumN family protein [Metallibacterium scheffleri]|uniref:TraB/GumN family protein n=1 Tax=Metallibacterium scheffleri TaxID=993689 RepID=UPI0023EFC620|nr:TraB/GumN family protein [Metallibacterium scheffleri]